MGLLRVTGIIDLGQYWPIQDSDADTTKVLVGVNAGSFTYRAYRYRTVQEDFGISQCHGRGASTRLVTTISPRTR